MYMYLVICIMSMIQRELIIATCFFDLSCQCKDTYHLWSDELVIYSGLLCELSPPSDFDIMRFGWQELANSVIATIIIGLTIVRVRTKYLYTQERIKGRSVQLQSNA